MITLHHLEKSRSHRVVWLLEELQVEYNIVNYERDKKTMLAPKKLKTIHPLGKSPVITDSETNITLAETGAIIDYLIDFYDQDKALRPEDKLIRTKYNFWLHYPEGSVMPILLLKLIFSRLDKPPMPFIIRPIGKMIANGMQQKFISPRMKEHLDYINFEMKGNTWLCGEQFTGADIMLSFILQAAQARGGLNGYSNIQKLLQRMESREAYQRTENKVGELNFIS